jgi:hypothetical protein
MHHVDWWDHNGRTDCGNGLPVCGHDHYKVHEGGWRVERDPQTGTIDWYRPDGTHAGQTHPRTRPKPIPVHNADDDTIRARERAQALTAQPRAA